MKLSDYINVEKLHSHIENGLVTARRHDKLPLTIYCYSKKVTYGNIWDDVTRKTRGLIVDDNDNIIARPYEKFFSVDQPGGYSLRELEALDLAYDSVVTEKINGHLGIFWKYGTHWGIATKGSFHSPHAEWATKWLENLIESHGKLVFPEGYTPVFEIVCQEIQPHTIEYASDFVSLLSFVNIETGEELSLKESLTYANRNNLPHVVNYPLLRFKYVLTHDMDFMEGYVVTWNIPGQAPVKIKIKFPTFIKNRREFYAKQKMAKIEVQVEDKDKEIAKEIVLSALRECTTRKEFAEYFNKEENKAYASKCFRLLDY
jgi:RNA ligase